MQTVANKVFARIVGSKGSAWKPRDFLDLGSRSAVDQALLRLTAAGKIRRIGRGLYDRPVQGALVGPRSVSPAAVAKAAGRADAARVQPSGAVAANALGLSTQVPAQADFLTTANSRVIDAGGRTVRLRRVAPRRLALTVGATTVTEALRFIGADAAARLGPLDFTRIASALNDADVRSLQTGARHYPAWMRPTIEAILAARAAG